MSDFLDKMKDFGETALNKTADLVDTGTTKASIMRLKGKIKDEQEKIGAYFYANRAILAGDETLDALCAKIDELQKQIDDLNNELEIGKQ